LYSGQIGLGKNLNPNPKFVGSFSLKQQHASPF
jgi:hypothetical protein